jgi:hypothetical protein
VSTKNPIIFFSSLNSYVNSFAAPVSRWSPVLRFFSPLSLQILAESWILVESF